MASLQDLIIRPLPSFTRLSWVLNNFKLWLGFQSFIDTCYYLRYKMIRFVISLQISMLQDELSRLTLTELDKREERQDVERVCNLVFHSSIKIWNQKGRPWMETTKRILTYSFSRRVVLTLIEFTLRSDISRKWTPLSMIKWRDCNCYGFKAIRPF